MWRFLIVSLCLGYVLSAVDWVSKAQVPNYTGFFSKVVQEVVYDLEKFEWCNLKIQEYSQNLDEQLYQWHVNGKVTYKNGFVVSIQELDITHIDQSVMNRMVNGVAVPHATVKGRLNMRQVKIGFDVIVDLVNPDPPYAPHQRFTGHFTHPQIELQLDVMKNLLTKEITSSSYVYGLGSSTGIKMIYMPANNLTEVLSRKFMPSNSANSMDTWCKTIIMPMLVDASNRVEFPEICFTNCPK